MHRPHARRDADGDWEGVPKNISLSPLAVQLIARLRSIDTSVDPRTKGFDYAAHTAPLEEVLDAVYNALLVGTMTEAEATAISKEALRIRGEMRARVHKAERDR